MGDVAEVIGGGTPRTSEASYFEKGDIPWLTPADLSGYDEKFIGRGRRNITRLGLAESSARLMPSGTVLFTSRAPIGYVAIAANPMATNQGFKSFVLRDSLNPGYIYYYLQFATPIITEFASGTTFLEISGQNAKKIPVPVAPKREQRRIVEAIESYLTRLDDAVATLERVQRNLKRYRASVLKAAVEGRLVPTEAELARKENREYEPASVLLARILKERKHRFIEDAAEKGRAKAEAKAKSASKAWTDVDDEKTLAAERAKAAKKYREPTAPDTSELPELPEGWCWATTEQCVNTQVGHAFKSDDFLDVGTNLLRGDNIGHGELRWEGSRRKCIAEEVQFQFPHLLLEVYDIILAMDRPMISTGLKIARVRSFDVPALLVQRVLRLRPAIHHDYFYAVLLSPFFSQHLRENEKGGGVPHISEGQIQDFVFPVPPLSEQHRITREVDRLLTIEGRSESAASRNASRANRLRQSILKWAFEGKLVDQDPNDEPASALLERIKAERSASKPSTKATRSSRKRKTA